MSLTSKQTRYLRSLAHHLSPAVQMGKAGLTDAIIKEVDRNLNDHELIKVKITSEDRDELKDFAVQFAANNNAALVQLIGHTAVLYRAADKPKIKLA